MSCAIRPCIPADYTALETMTRDAFWDVYKPGCDEHYLVHMLHEKNAPVPELNLAAVYDGKIVGHALCVKARLLCSEQVYDDVLCLGPLTVSPSCQRNGVGSKLMQETIRRAASLGWRAIFLTGNPAYYHRFGYRATRDFGITFPDGSTMDELMVLPLYEDALTGKAGIYEEPPVYGEFTLADVLAFDKRFPPREKHVLPTQIFHPEEY